MKKVVMFFSLACFSIQVSAKGFSVLEKDESFEPYYYVAGGLSYSFLDPEKDGTTAFKVSDNNDIGFRLAGGYRFDNVWSGEAIYMDLGSAGVSTVIPGSNVGGDVSYKIFGAHANYFFGQDFVEQDISTFLKLGLSSVRVSDNVPFLKVEKENSVTIMTGIGITKPWKPDWDFRFDLDFFSRDAAALTVGLQYRVPEKHQPPKEEPPLDTDGDGVMDPEDQCPDTEIGVEVDEVGCKVIKKEEIVEQALKVIDLKSINFESNSDKLLSESLSALDQTADVLIANPEVIVEISAHTDSSGSEKYNQKLSQRRADSVRYYLLGKGVAEESMSAIGYGEAQPIADNDTSEGKAANRRVEFKVIVEEESEAVMQAEELEVQSADDAPEEVVVPEDAVSGQSIPEEKSEAEAGVESSVQIEELE